MHALPPAGELPTWAPPPSTRVTSTPHVISLTASMMVDARGGGIHTFHGANTKSSVCAGASPGGADVTVRLRLRADKRS
jgi:hypothetical protein